jgi:hypothetical protein
MSKTRKTRPLDVRLGDKADKGVDYEVCHNHTNGRDCSLPENPKQQHKLTAAEYRELYYNGCYYHFKYVGKGVCGCPMCTNKVERKQDITRSRHEAKKETTQYVKENRS